MPIYDAECNECGEIFEFIGKINQETTVCPKCSGISKKIFPQSAPDFKLKYNNSEDMCDWDGNTSQYWRKYKEMKAEGKNPRIPQLDGE